MRTKERANEKKHERLTFDFIISVTSQRNTKKANTP